MAQQKAQHKKKYYPINTTLRSYLEKYKRLTKTNVFYDDLLRFHGSIVVYDKITEDQLEDYAKRRKISKEDAAKWLNPNLSPS